MGTSGIALVANFPTVRVPPMDISRTDATDLVTYINFIEDRDAARARPLESLIGLITHTGGRRPSTRAELARTEAAIPLLFASLAVGDDIVGTRAVVTATPLPATTRPYSLCVRSVYFATKCFAAVISLSPSIPARPTLTFHSWIAGSLAWTQAS